MLKRVVIVVLLASVLVLTSANVLMAGKNAAPTAAVTSSLEFNTECPYGAIAIFSGSGTAKVTWNYLDGTSTTNTYNLWFPMSRIVMNPRATFYTTVVLNTPNGSGKLYSVSCASKPETSSPF